MSTRYRLIIPGLVLLGALAGLWAFSHRSRTATLEMGDEAFLIEIADTPQRWTQGLGGREMLATSTGMLFVFDEPGIYSFWMKDMAFPIDIAWIDSDWCIVNVATNVSPDTYPDHFTPSKKAAFVLEVNAGVLASKNIAISYCFQPPLI